MPKKLSDDQKKEIIDFFVNGMSIEELSKNFKCTKNTITRHLKKGISEKLFKNLLKNNKSHKNAENKRNSESNLHIENLEDNFNEVMFEETSFVEIAPLEFEIDNEPQNDLSSISINEIDFPKTVYMIVDNKIELETKYLRDYPDWQFLSDKDLDRKTIEIHFDMKIAKRSCTKEQKLIKVPNSNVFKVAAPILISKGITRIVSPNNLISL